MAAQVGEFVELLRLALGAVVAFVRRVEGSGNEGDGVVRGQGFQVDQAEGEGVLEDVRECRQASPPGHGMASAPQAP